MYAKFLKYGVGAAFVLSASMAQAVQTSSFGTTFTSSESLWQGTGIPATGFDTGNIRIPPTGIGVEVRARANTGTANATVRGTLSATYDEVIGQNQATSVKLNFGGGSSNVSSAFGASATAGAFVNVCVIPDPIFGGCITRVNESFDLAGVGAFLNPTRNFTSNLGANSGNGSDQEEVTSVGSLDLGPLGRLGASIDLDFRQTISLTQGGMDGILSGRNTNTGETITRAFSIGGSDMTNVALGGLDWGLWEFSILDIDLFATFVNTASMVVEPTVNYIVGSTAIASLNIPLITNTFGMDFNTLQNLRTFEILVTPLPAAFWLFGSALIGFVGYARRRKVT